MPSQRALELCNSTETVTKAFAKKPTRPVSAVTKGIFKRIPPVKDVGKEESELDKAARCGRFPNRPSELFLKIYNDALGALNSGPLVNMVSPSLIGASGVIPLSIVSVIPDIMRHYAELIVRAETEVFLATNYWEPSHSSTIISDSLRELSKRVQARGGKRVVVKLMYDRGSLKQLITPRIVVPPSGWKKVNLPTEDEIPGISLQVVNFHQPMLGTFHAKYLVVDRRVACVNSNNIQDRPNVEMMVHLEGPIVDSFYDMALLSWSNVMKPPLPLLSKQPVYPEEFKFNHDNESLKYLTAAQVAERLNIGRVKLDATVEDAGVADFRPYILHKFHSPCPIAMVNRKPTGSPGHRLNNPQDLSWLSAIKHAQKSIFIQTPTFNAAPLIPATLDACRRGIEVTLFLDLGFNDQGEQIPFQGGTNEMVVHNMYDVLNKEKKGNEKNLHVFWYTGKDQKRPINAAAKKRNCHVKFMAIDESIAIFGNGNQDTQSWFHSMEINLMVDSPPLVREWLSGLDANQNTRLFGRVSDIDGIWRDGDEVVQASGVGKATFMDWMRSIRSVLRRLRGSGGF
ncbi:hypothetical protein K488DRAFT_43117 [Vararia minispora EC-137]|uniref:Uncharacterized protein n=1 Tax=Vararia minispora EC-137 TaxID=1314806 RepID=A0ACB8QV01_9AGAM|nr:hypothetical protein K488DRAFT_43117 [Vararia minispora EC-137]